MIQMDKKARQRIAVPITLGLLAGLPIWAAVTGKVVIGYFATALIFLYGIILAVMGFGALVFLITNEECTDRDKRLIALKELCNLRPLKVFEAIMWMVLPVVFVATGHLFAALWYAVFAGMVWSSIKAIRKKHGHECADSVVP